MTSISRNVLSSAVGALTNQVVRAAQQVLWVPLFLTAFGKEGYGEWLTLFGLAGYAAMSDLGVQVYWLNLLTGAYTRGDIENYRRLFRAGVSLFCVISSLTFLLGVTFSLWNGPARMLHLRVIPGSDASMTFLVLVVSTLLVVFSRMLRDVFRTAGENPKTVWFEVVRELVTCLLVVGALLARLGPSGLAWVYGAVAIFSLAWVAIVTQRRFSDWIDLRIFRADAITVRAIASGGTIHLAGVMASLLLIQGTLILSGWSLGAAAVALVATTRTLINLVRQAAGSIYVAALPEFCRLEAANDRSGMEKLLCRSVSLVTILSGAACVLLAGVGPRLFDLWTGGRFLGAAPLLYWFTASVLVDATRMTLHDFLLGCNRILRVSAANVIHAVSSLVAMWLLFPHLKEASVPISIMCCGVALHLPILVRGAANILGSGVLNRLLSRAALGAVATVLACAPLVIDTAALSVTSLVSRTLAALLVFLILAWWLLLDRADSAWIKGRIASWMTS